MHPRLAFAFVVLLLVAAWAPGQGIITPRRLKSPDAQAANAPETPSSGAAKQKPEIGAASEAGLPSALPVSAVKLRAAIDGQVATVRVDHLFRNETDYALEGTYYFPVPEGATLLEFAVYDGDQRRLGRVKEKEEARAAYAAGVGQGEDPAILEMTRRGWFQSHVYPIPAHSDKRVDIVYSQVLAAKENIVTFDYPLGRGYKKLKVPVGEVDIEVELRARTAISSFFSPTHALEIEFDGERHVTSRLKTGGGGDAENFKLTYSLADEEVSASLMTYRKEGEDGYFLLILSPKVDFDPRRISAKDVVFVIDASLSMEGDKIRQAKEALRFGLTRTLNENDRFNVIAFGGEVIPMQQRMIKATPANVARALDFVDKLQLISATNINDALVAAMKMFEPGARAKNLVFITDGQPTASVADPERIAANVRSANAANARLFTFGVGADVNKRLLEKLAAENRGDVSTIGDHSQLGRTVSGFFSKVSQPVLSDLRVDFGALLVDRVHPAELPDLYTRSQIKVFGRYRSAEELRDAVIALAGNMNGHPQRFEFSGLDFPLVSTDKEFLPKLWATERVNALLAEIRLHGERAESKQEVIELAREFNLVTPYTSMYVPTSGETGREEFRGQTEEARTSGTGSGPGPGSTAAAMNSQQIANLPISGRQFTSLVSIAPGTVVDPNGEVIPNATVVIRDRSTGAERTVTTDGAGNYSVAGLQPGAYTVEVTAPGFNKTVVDKVVVQPGQVAAAGVALSVASASETVTVTSVVSALNTDTSHVSSSYESRKIRDLPSLLPVDSFTRLAPGVEGTASDDACRSISGAKSDREFLFSVNGNRARSKTYLVNHLNNNRIDGGPVVAIHNFDAVDTLHLLSTRGSGDVSRTGASSLTLSTRAGTNEFHGTLFDYHLNRRLGSMSPLERRSGLEGAPLFKSTLYGGTLGGPIKRDRAFFFGAFEGEIERSRRFVDSTAAMLTPSEQGLVQLRSLFPGSPTVDDLIARGPFAAALGNPRVVRTFAIPVAGSIVEFAELARIIRSSTSGFETGGRVDFALTNRDQLQVNYWYDGRKATNAAGQLAAGIAGDVRARGQLGGVRWTHTMSPRTTSETGFGFSRASASFGATGEGGAVTVVMGVRGLGYGGDSFLPTSTASRLFELSEAVTHIAGRHNIRLGGQVSYRTTDFDSLPGHEGVFSYATFEDFAMDRPTALTVAIGDSRSRFTELHQHYYIDDAWRWRSNVTLSFGLSYENATQPLDGFIERLRRREANAATALFDTTIPVEQRVPDRVKRDLNNVAPRFGLAYTPRFRVFGRNLFGNDQTVIRAGASASYDQTAYRPLADVASNAPSVLLATLTPGLASISAFPGVPGASELRSILGGNPDRYARTELTPDYRNPYSLSWHLTASRDFNRFVLETGYIGSRGVGLIRTIDGNPLVGEARVGSGPLRVYSSTGRSTYHSLQARSDLRFADVLNASFSYTLSRMIDDVPDNGASLGSLGAAASALQTFSQNPFDLSAERASSSLNRRHVFRADFTWTLPIGRAQHGFLGRLLGGWQATGIIEAASGTRYTPIQFLGHSPASAALFASIFSDRLGAVRPFEGNAGAPADAVAFSNAASAFFRFFRNPDGTPFVSPTGFIIANRTGYRAGSLPEARFVYNDFAVEQAARAIGLAPDAFGQTFAAGRPFGNARRNSLLGQSLRNIDFAMLKTTKLTEKVSLQFRGEFFNLFNHPNRPIPNFILENAGGFGFNDPGETDASPRRVRLAVKLIF